MEGGSGLTGARNPYLGHVRGGALHGVVLPSEAEAVSRLGHAQDAAEEAGPCLGHRARTRQEEGAGPCLGARTRYQVEGAVHGRDHALGAFLQRKRAEGVEGEGHHANPPQRDQADANFRPNRGGASHVPCHYLHQDNDSPSSGGAGHVC